MKTKAQIEKDILEVIEVEKLFVITDVFAFYKGCCRSTFYNWGMDRLDSIKNAIENNKRTTCQSLKNKWFTSENPTLQLALFKIICADDERKALSMTHLDITSNNQTIKFVIKDD